MQLQVPATKPNKAPITILVIKLGMICSGFGFSGNTADTQMIGKSIPPPSVLNMRYLNIRLRKFWRLRSGSQQLLQQSNTFLCVSNTIFTELARLFDSDDSGQGFLPYNFQL